MHTCRLHEVNTVLRYPVGAGMVVFKQEQQLLQILNTDKSFNEHCCLFITSLCQYCAVNNCRTLIVYNIERKNIIFIKIPKHIKSIQIPKNA